MSGRMRKSVGTRAEAVAHEHRHTCPPMLSVTSTVWLGTV